MLDRPPRVDHHQQHAGILAFDGGFAMRDQTIGGEPDQVVAVMGDIAYDGAGPGQAFSAPWRGKTDEKGHDRPRDLCTGCICSCARIQS